jgi:hypothetical protein
MSEFLSFMSIPVIHVVALGIHVIARLIRLIAPGIHVIQLIALRLFRPASTKVAREGAGPGVKYVFLGL